jgi:hypothetical protein
MKKFFVVVIVAFLMPPLFMNAMDTRCSTDLEKDVAVESQEEDTHKKLQAKPPFFDEDDKVAQLVIASWLGMVSNVVQIGRDPHDKQNVGSNVSQMIHSIAHVVSEATKKYNISPEEFMNICKRRCSL